MILATHAIVGAAVGRVLSNPWAAFLAGFSSHFILDAIPHWQYRLASRRCAPDTMHEDMVRGKGFLRDIVLIGLDFFLGMTLSIVLFQNWSAISRLPMSVLFGALGGVSPDALQFMSWKIRKEPFTTFQKFHDWVHADEDLDHKPKLGVLLQGALAAAVVLLSKILVK